MKYRIAAFAALALLVPATAEGGPPGAWTKVTGIGQANLNIDRLSAARTPDGVLHFVSVRRSGLGGTVQHRTLSANAKQLGPTTDIYTYPGGINESPLLLAAPGGLRAFFSGLYFGSALDQGLATATSASGTSWVVKPNLASHANPAAAVYAASGIGAALLNDGTPLTAWGSTASAFHVGIDPLVADVAYSSGCCDYDPGVGVDAASGQAVFAWKFIANDGSTGTVTRALALGSALVQPPGAAAADTGSLTGITGRLGGQPGVYVAYQLGTNQFLSKPAVWRFGSSTATTLSSKAGARSVGISQAPEGRLWVFWHRDGRLYARRSNKAATNWGALRSVAPAKGTQTIHRVAGEGSAGPLDVFGLFDRGGGDLGYWQTRVLPVLTLSSAKGKTITLKKGKKSFKKTQVTFKVTDVGDPVAGAAVSVAGGGSKTTGGSGKVTFTLSPGAHSAHAKKTGYAPATAGLKL
jgi:hypothetical protein